MTWRIESFGPYDPAEFDEDDQFHFEKMGYTFRVENRHTDEEGTQYCDVVSVEPDGKVVHVQEFAHRQAFEDAGSYMAAAVECATYTLEERLGPYGLEWEREQAERMGYGS